MPNISELKESRFITKNDVNPPAQFTVVGTEQVNVAKEGMQPEIRWAINLRETEKPFILNSTNGQIIAQFMGSDEMNDWNNRKIVIYYDPSVSFGGKLVGGLRVRAPRSQPAIAVPGASKSATDAPVADQDAPFN